MAVSYCLYMRYNAVIFVFRYWPHEFPWTKPPVEIEQPRLYQTMWSFILWPRPSQYRSFHRLSKCMPMGKWCIPKEATSVWGWRNRCYVHCMYFIPWMVLRPHHLVHWSSSSGDTHTSNATYRAAIVTSSCPVKVSHTHSSKDGEVDLTRKMRVYWSHYSPSCWIIVQYWQEICTPLY